LLTAEPTLKALPDAEGRSWTYSAYSSRPNWSFGLGLHTNDNWIRLPLQSMCLMQPVFIQDWTSAAVTWNHPVSSCVNGSDRHQPFAPGVEVVLTLQRWWDSNP